MPPIGTSLALCPSTALASRSPIELSTKVADQTTVNANPTSAAMATTSHGRCGKLPVTNGDVAADPGRTTPPSSNGLTICLVIWSPGVRTGLRAVSLGGRPRSAGHESLADRECAQSASERIRPLSCVPRRPRPLTADRLRVRVEHMFDESVALLDCSDAAPSVWIEDYFDSLEVQASVESLDA